MTCSAWAANPGRPCRCSDLLARVAVTIGSLGLPVGQLGGGEEHTRLGDLGRRRRPPPASRRGLRRLPRLAVQVGAGQRPRPTHQVEADRRTDRTEAVVGLVEPSQRGRQVAGDGQHEPEVVEELGLGQHGLLGAGDGDRLLQVVHRGIDPAGEGEGDGAVVEHAKAVTSGSRPSRAVP